MQYITAQKAAQLWGLKVRQVQSLCKSGRIEGANRFGRTWAIPEKAFKPKDDRCRESDGGVKEDVNKVDFLSGLPPVYKQLLDNFPYSVNVTDTDGFMVYANESFFEGTLEDARANSIGTYNILNEELLEMWGLREHIEKAFRGERVVTRNLKFPNKQLDGTKYGKEYAFVTIYNDVSSFPIFDEHNRLLYVVSVFIPVRRFHARVEVSKVKEYIEAHWKEPFNTKLAAKSVNLSQSNLLKMFKADTGFTLHEYYIDVKLNHLKQRLLDLNVSVAHAFHECGIDYNSHYTALFRKHTGMTPMQFRKNNR